MCLFPNSLNIITSIYPSYFIFTEYLPRQFLTYLTTINNHYYIASSQ